MGTNTLGAILVADGTNFNPVVLSGDASINASGALTIDYSAAQSASAVNKGFLTSADWTTFNNKQAALGFTAEDVANKSTDTALGISDAFYPTQKAVKTYIDNKELGLVWHDALELINVVADRDTPETSPQINDAYIINTGGDTGVWSAFAPGDLVQYQQGSGWVLIKSMVVGDRFGVSFKTTTTAYNSFLVKDDNLVQITGGSPGAFTYTFESPNNNDAVLVDNVNAFYNGVSFTYSSHIGGWVQFSAAVSYSFGNGLNVSGTTVSLGALTSDWTQSGAFDIVTAGDLFLNGGDLNTTSGTATLFNTGATTLNIGGAATNIGLGAAGATVTGGGALTLSSGSNTALTLDSGMTGALNLGTGNNAKTINLGTGTAGNIINIGTNNSTADTITIGSALDALSLTSTGLNVTALGALTGVASINTVFHSATAITFAGAGTLSSTGVNSLTVDSGTTGGVNIGTGSNEKTITIGNTTGATSLVLNAGTGNIDIGTNSVSRTINIGSGSTAGGIINIGVNPSGGSARTINIATGSTGDTVNIGVGSAGAGKTINIGTGIVSTAVNVATGQTGGLISMGTAMTTGTISIGGTGAQTGTITFGGGTGAQTVNLGTGSTGVKTINLGTGTAANVISIGTGQTGGSISMGSAMTTGTITIGGSNGQSGTINIGSGLNITSTINIGSGLSGNKTINIGNNAGVQTVSLGSNSSSSITNINSGSGGIQIGTNDTTRTINIGTAATAVQTINMGGAAANIIAIGNTQTAGSVSIGAAMTTGAISIGNTTGTTILNLRSGTGNIGLQVAGTGTTGNVQIGAGGGGSATPDRLVLDIKSTSGDPIGTNGAMYYNSNTNKFRCFENSTWVNCITPPGSDIQHVTSYDTDESLTNITSSETTLGTVSITPSSATGDIYVTGQADVISGDEEDSLFFLTIETGATCEGDTVGDAVRSYGISAPLGTDRGTIIVSGIAVDPGASEQSYSLCAYTEGGKIDVMNWMIEATVIDNGADVAEIYTTNDESLEAGDVVSLDANLRTGVRKSENSFDKNVLGIVSTKPGILIGGVGQEGVQAVPVALSGRVPVKVTTENGAIQPGDYLVPSSVSGVAMRSNGSGVVIGQALSTFSGPDTGIVLVFVKNFDLGQIGEMSVLLGDITPKTNADGSDNGLSPLVATIQSESVRDPVVLISQKISEGKQFLTDFVSARVTAIRGYFDEVFAKKVHTDQLCAKKSDGSEVCVNGDQIDTLLRNVGISPIVNTPIQTPESEPSPEPDPNLEPIPDEPDSTPEPVLESEPDPNLIPDPEPDPNLIPDPEPDPELAPD